MKSLSGTPAMDAALTRLCNDIVAAKVSAFDGMAMLLDMDSRGLINACGYNNLGEALIKTLKGAQRDIARLGATYEKENP